MSDSSAPALTVLFSVVMVLFCFVAVAAHNAAFIAFGAFAAGVITLYFWAVSEMDK